MSYWNLPLSVVRFAAEHFAKGLLSLSIGNGIASFSSWLKRQILVFLSIAQRSRCGNSRREVTSYKPLSDNNGSAATGPIDCVRIAEAVIAAHAHNDQAASVVAPSRVLRRVNVKRAFMRSSCFTSVRPSISRAAFAGGVTSGLIVAVAKSGSDGRSSAITCVLG